jgi:hypothetical protein
VALLFREGSVELTILDVFIFIAILIGIVALMILDWRETIAFVIFMGVALFVLFLGYSVVRELL